jgi:hypothetical protein
VTAPPLRILDYKAAVTLVDNCGKTVPHHLLENPSMPDEVILQSISRQEVGTTVLRKYNQYTGLSPLHYALHILRPKSATCYFPRR